MNAGELDRRLRILREVSFPGELAKESEWVTWAEVWAKHTPVSDGERVRAAQTGAVLTDRFLIRWSPDVFDVSAKDQLEFEGVRYQITGAKPIGRREGIELTAVARGER